MGERTKPSGKRILGSAKDPFTNSMGLKEKKRNAGTQRGGRLISPLNGILKFVLQKIHHGGNPRGNI